MRLDKIIWILLVSLFLTNCTATRSNVGATLGANCTVVCGTTIGEYAFIGAGAVVRSNFKPYALVVGIPAKQIGWMSAYGERIDLPLKGNKTWLCKRTNLLYKLIDSNLIAIPNY